MNALAALASNRSRQAAARLVEAVTGGDGVVGYEDEAVRGRTAALDRAAAELAATRVHVIRVAAPASGSFNLPALVAQIAGQADPAALSDGDVELAFQALTEPDEGCPWIALLVDDAECLQPPALRYLQFTCRSVPELRLVLAGEPGFLELLDGDEFAPLRERLTRAPPRPAAPVEQSSSAEAPPPEPALVEAVPVEAVPAAAAARRPVALWMLIAIAMLASVGLGVWTARQDAPPVGAATAPER